MEVRKTEIPQKPDFDRQELTLKNFCPLFPDSIRRGNVDS
jgi:hypothetical protein